MRTVVLVTVVALLPVALLSASSIVLNLAEGSGARGGIRRERYRTALGSAREVEACIAVARAWRYVDVEVVGLREVIGTLVKVTR